MVLILIMVDGDMKGRADVLDMKLQLKMFLLNYLD